MGCAVGSMRSRVPGNVRSGACAEGVLVAVLVRCGSGLPGELDSGGLVIIMTNVVNNSLAKTFQVITITHSHYLLTA